MNLRTISDTWRHGVSFRVKGDPIVHVDSREQHPGRIDPRHWTEMSLYEGVDSPYVLEKSGCSRVEGERTYTSVFDIYDVFDLYHGLRQRSRQTGDFYLTNAAKVMLYRSLKRFDRMLNQLNHVSERSDARSEAEIIRRMFNAGREFDRSNRSYE